MVETLRMGPEDWQRVRELRLAALEESPDAFARRLEEEAEQPATFWQGRLESAAAVTFVATKDDADFGIVTAAPYQGRDRSAGLFSMWVAPEARGSGVGDALVAAVVGWARVRGYVRLSLDVADGNDAAIGLYRRHGFEPTGESGALPPPREHVREHELSLVL